MNDDPSICTCGCHATPPRLIHVMPCCSPCDACKKRVKNGMASTHAKTCSRATR